MDEDKLIKILQLKCPSDLASFEYNGALTKINKNKKIKKIGVSLGFSKKSIQSAIKKNIDFLILHNAPERLDKNHKYFGEILKLAEKANLSIYRLHLPLDFVKGGLIDNLCKSLKLKSKLTVLKYKNFKIKGGVYVSVQKISYDELIKKISNINPTTLRIVNSKKKVFKKIAITTGDGCYPEFLIQLKPDVFICGLLNQEAIRVANDLNITLIEATSYATENLPLKIFTNDLKKLISNVNIEFIDVKNDVMPIC